MDWWPIPEGDDDVDPGSSTASSYYHENVPGFLPAQPYTGDWK